MVLISNLPYFLLYFILGQFSNIWYLSFIISLNMFCEIENKGPLFWSWTKVLKFWILIFRNVPKIIEALSIDGSCGQQIESSKLDPLSGVV